MSEYKFENCVVTVYDFRNLVIPAGATINIYGSGFKVSATGNDQKQDSQKQANDASSSVTVEPATNNNVQTSVNTPVSTLVDQEYKVDDLKAAIDSQDVITEFLAAIRDNVDNGKISGSFCFDVDDCPDFDYWLTTKNKPPLSDRNKYSIAQFAKDFNISAV
jgi:hypothetical protein